MRWVIGTSKGASVLRGVVAFGLFVAAVLACR